MKTLARTAIVVMALLALPSGATAAKSGTGTTNIQLLTVSDWHGQVVPLSTTPPVGGAAVLKASSTTCRRSAR
jgi:hypothetical protein